MIVPERVAVHPLHGRIVDHGEAEIHGPARAVQWGTNRRPADFFDLKGDLEAVLRQVSPDLQRFEFRAEAHPALHPGQSAALYREGVRVGWLGLLHPQLAGQMDLPGSVGLFQVELDALSQRSLPEYREMSRFPAVRRDLAVVVDEQTPAARLLGIIRENSPAELEDLQLFDLYQGEGVDPGKKSLALTLIFRGLSSTLIEADVEQCVSKILAVLEREVGARLRA